MRASAISRRCSSWSGPANPRARPWTRRCSRPKAKPDAGAALISTPSSATVLHDRNSTSAHMSNDTGKALAAIPGTILLAGAGKMGSAMLTGWLNAGVALSRIAVIEPHLSDDLRKLAALDLRINPTTDEAGPLAALVVAVKPQTFGEAAALLKTFTSPTTLVVSIMAGMTIDKIARGCGGAVVRAMPNTPAAIGRGMTVASAAPAVNAAQRA